MNIEVDDMRQFFANVVDTVNNLSAQAGLVSGLQQQVNDLRERITSLEQQNYNLQAQLNDANGRVEQLNRTNTEVQGQLDYSRNDAQSLRDTIVQRDQAVADLSDQVRSEIDSHRITKADLEDSRRSTQEWEQNYNNTRDTLNSVIAERDEWRRRAVENESRANELQSQADRLRAVLNPSVPSGQLNVG